ncbi:MAG: hypothetical protein ACFB9M_03170 [Myxococcota bacterium]
MDTLRLDQMGALPARLRMRTAEIRVDVRAQKDFPTVPAHRVGFGVPWDERSVVVLAYVVQDARSIQVHGPEGSAAARLVHLDLEARVARLEVDDALAELGLTAPGRRGAGTLEAHTDVVALTTTAAGGTAVSGLVTDPGLRPEFEGFVATTLELKGGMPIFDTQLRLLGIARTVAWDVHQNLVIPPAKIRASLAHPKMPLERPTESTDPARETRPWWAKELPR